MRSNDIKIGQNGIHLTIQAYNNKAKRHMPVLPSGYLPVVPGSPFILMHVLAFAISRRSINQNSMPVNQLLFAIIFFCGVGAFDKKYLDKNTITRWFFNAFVTKLLIDNLTSPILNNFAPYVSSLLQLIIPDKYKFITDPLANILIKNITDVITDESMKQLRVANNISNSEDTTINNISERVCQHVSYARMIKDITPDIMTRVAIMPLMCAISVYVENEKLSKIAFIALSIISEITIKKYFIDKMVASDKTYSDDNKLFILS